jgi:hypothetical protein
MSTDFLIAPGGPRVEIDAEGAWLVDGEPIVHPTVLANLVERLDRRADGVYVIRAGGGELPVPVADAPFVVRTAEVTRTAHGLIAGVRMLLSDGTEEPLDLGTLSRVPGPGDRLACRVKAGRFEARFSRFATFQLLAAAEPTADGRARLDTTGGAVVV